jgi:hypothetical protein
MSHPVEPGQRCPGRRVTTPYPDRTAYTPRATPTDG